MKRYWPALLLLFLTAIFVFPSIISGKAFIYADNLTHKYQTMHYFRARLKQGNFPLWNPLILGGTPFFADLALNALAPTNLFYLTLPPAHALNLLIFFYLFLALYFTYRYALLLTSESWPALFSAVVFGFSGSTVAAFNDLTSLQGIAYLPLVFFLAELVLRKTNWQNICWLATALFLQFISSHPQYTYYTLIFTSAYFFSNNRLSFFKKIKLQTLIFSLFLGLAAVQLLPFWEFTQQSFRPESLSFSVENQLRIIEIPRLLLAEFYGSWKSGNSWGPGSQRETGLANSEGYLSLFALFLAGYSVFKVKRRNKIFWFCTALLAFILSLGNQTPVFLLFYQVLPFFSGFRSPIRILTVYSFAVSVLAGLGLKKLMTKKVMKI